MVRKYSHQLTAGISFGLTTAVITSLGMIVGLNSATSSKLAVVAGVIVMAIADGLSDSISLHTSEESEIRKGKAEHTKKEIWLVTLFTFLSIFCFTLTFVVPILLFPLKNAVLVAITWGIFLLIILNFYVARIRKENPIKLISEHLLLAIFVIIISYWVGTLIRIWFG